MTEISVEQNVLDENSREAAANRARFRQAGVYVLNLMSGPGAGKTTLLERTADALGQKLRLGVIAGDIETRRDADRIARPGVQVHQIETGGACHIDARVLGKAVDAFDLSTLDALIIENVGNLVCPAEFDLGEADKAMILSVAEGHDKPAKYPLMFREARVLLLNKIDLLPYTNFSVAAAMKDVRALNPGMLVMQTSARTGEGLEAWYRWFEERVHEGKAK